MFLEQAVLPPFPGVVAAEGSQVLQPQALHELSEAQRTHRGGRCSEVSSNLSAEH